MDNCKFCGFELPEDTSVCPACGKDNAEAVEIAQTDNAPQTLEEEIEETVSIIEDKHPASKNKVLFAIIAFLMAVLIVLIALLIGRGKTEAELPESEVSGVPAVEATIPADGVAGTITEKGSYTVSDDVLLANRDTVVAVCGDNELTAAQLQIYYWMQVRSFLNAYGAYAAYYGMDASQSLDTQVCGVAEGVTWQQYFLESALNDWQVYQSMAAAAQEKGLTLDADQQAVIDSVESDMDTAAAQSGYESGAAMVEATMGPGCTVADYRQYLETYYTGYAYYQAWREENVASDADVEAFFAEHEGEYADNGITKDARKVNVRHILIMPEAGEDNAISDEAWAEAEKQAKNVLKKYKSGKKTEDAFAALANEYSQDPGSNTNGGLYRDVTEGQMVPEFNDWCFDAARESSDTDIVRTDYGYHVMYFVSSNSVWQDYARSDLENKRANDFITSISAQYPITVEYGKLMLGNVNFG